MSRIFNGCCIVFIIGSFVYMKNQEKDPKQLYRPVWSMKDYERMDSGKPPLNPPSYVR